MLNPHGNNFSVCKVSLPAMKKSEIVMDLSLMSKAAGPNLRLRLIQPEDAAYVHGLRTHPAYSGHLSKVTGSVADQRQWIEACKTQEAAGQSLYYTDRDIFFVYSRRRFEADRKAYLDILQKEACQ